MDFIDEIRALAARIPKQLEHIQTEEATKSALIMPFIQTLGYNVFDPTEVVPEYIADIGTKKGEKADYAILMDNKPMMLFECKWCGRDLGGEDASQLYRYFSATAARIGVLTNGVIYRFFSDLEQPNIMDQRPFLVFDMQNIHESLVTELKKLSKNAFDLKEMLSTASDLKYTREMRKILREELRSPSENFTRFLASQVYSGRLTQSVREQFTDIVKRAFNQFINEMINARLISAMEEVAPPEPPSTEPEEEEVQEEGDRESRIETTNEELEGYYIVKSILRDIIDPGRIAHRDTISYMGILLDDNNRKPICRLHFNNQDIKYVSLFGENREEEKVQIRKLDDLYKYSDMLKFIVSYYDAN